MPDSKQELAPGKFSAGLVGLGKLLIAIQEPDGTVVTIENIAAQIDPAILLEIMAAQIIIPFFGALLEFLRNAARGLCSY